MRVSIRLYSVTEAAGVLQLHENTVRAHIRSGRLPAQKVGREFAILEPDLRWFAEQERKPGRPPNK